MPRKEYTRQINLQINGQQVIDKLQAALREADAEFDRVNDNFEEMKAKASMLEKELEDLKNNTGVDILERQLRRFKQTAEVSLQEFKTFLQSVNLNDDFGRNDWRFEDYYDEIKRGSLTANTAITQLKINMAELFEESYRSGSSLFDEHTVQSFNASLNTMSDTISTVLEKLERIEREGVAVSGGGGFGGGNIAEMFEQIRATAERMGESTNGAIENVKHLVEAITSYAELDTTKLLGVSQAFDNMKGLASHSLSSKTVDNIIELVTRLRSLNELGGVNFHFDSSGIAALNGVKLSKTLYYLVDVLPNIDKVNADNIDRIAKVDWNSLANIGNVKLSKANAENIKELFTALGANTGAAASAESAAVKQEGASIEDVNKLYESHKAAVEAAVAAEKEKAATSVTVAHSLDAERKSVKRDNDEVEKHKKALTDLVRLLTSVQGEKAKLSGTNSMAEVQGLTELEGEINRLIAEDEAHAKASDVLRAKLVDLRLAYEQLRQPSAERKRDAQDIAAAEREEAKAAEDARKAANQIEDLEARVARLRDSGAFDSTIIENLRNLQAVMADSSKSTEERAGAFEKFKVAADEATRSVKALETAEKDKIKAEKDALAAEARKQQLLKQAESLLQRVTSAQENWSKAQNNPATRAEYEQLSRYKTELDGLIVKLKDGEIGTSEFHQRLRALDAEFAHSKSVITGAGSAIKSYFGKGMQLLSNRLSYTFGFAAIVTKTIAEVRKMITTAVELDTAMNQLQIVTRGSTQDMQDYAESISQIAKETAQSTKDLIDATTVYARLGYTMDESKTLAKYTAMLQGVGAIDASAAQDAMTAIIKAFDKDVSDVEDVMDKMVVVGNNFPISVSQIAEGMNNAGSMLAVAGNSFEESVALLTASNTTVQNISKASTGLRTIAARIRKNYEDLDELGEAIDEEKYKELVKMLEGKGMKLTTDNGEFRTTYEILKDIASVWNDLSTMQQNLITETIAGTRQQNVFASVVTQFQEAEKAMESMKNSSGQLEEAYAIRMDSIQAHVQTMKAAYEELSMTFVNSDFAKESIDFLTQLLELLNAILGPLGKILGYIGPIGTALTAGGITAFFKHLGRPFEGPLITEIYKPAYHGQGHAEMAA